MSADEMVKEAASLSKIHENIVVKIPMTTEGMKAVKILSSENIKTNVTLIFSAMQALQAMRSGAFYISPFIGWKEVNAEDVRQFIEEVVTIRDNYNFNSEVIVAAVRNARQIVDAAVVGADIVTAGLQVYKDGFHHPYTVEGIGKFTSFWDQTAYE